MATDYSKPLMRIWLEQLPENFKQVHGIATSETVGGLKLGKASNKSMAIKLSLGLSLPAGLLGAEYQVDGSHELKIQVVEFQDIDGHLVPKYTVKTILDEAVRTAEMRQRLFGGTLKFNHIVYNIFDASPLVFRIITHTLVMLLEPEFENASADEMFSILTDTRDAFRKQ